MAKTPKKGEETKRSVRKEAEKLGFGRLNYILMAIGLGVIVLGYIFLAAGSITIAPILLVLGYCAILPAAILVNGQPRKKPADADSG